MVRLTSRQRWGLAAFKLTKLFGIDDFPAAKDSGKVLIIVIYCYLIIINQGIILLSPQRSFERHSSYRGLSSSLPLSQTLKRTGKRESLVPRLA